MSKIKPYLMLLPAVFLILITFGFGFIHSLSMLINYNSDIFGELIKNAVVKKSILFSFKTAFVATTISAVLGLLLALLLFKVTNKKLTNITYKLPILIPYAFVALIIIDLFSSNGLIAKIVFYTGIVNNNSEFAMLVFDEWGVGIILAYIYKSTPFITMTLYALLIMIPKGEINIAKNLGAKRWNLFYLIILPKVKGQLLASYLIVFAFIFGSYEVPYLLGNARVEALPILSYNEYIKLGVEHKINSVAINLLMTTIGFAMLWVYLSVNKKLFSNNQL